jgi:collagenase-like PrtC family protease
MSNIELLAPARDLECGLAAINCGADAVYIGAPKFGARASAGNTLADIEALARYAHKYWAKVYITLNTLLYDDEVSEAARLAHQVYQAGADGLIIQDVGLLECNLPPLPLIASTQMHNHTPARVAFLEQVGFQRVILARELNLPQIKAIRQQAPTIELEFFVHGSLCVSYSGQCYLSYAIGGRSGNRGECAQPCRRLYSLVDDNGQILVKDRHLLSLHDLNLSDYLADLLDAGVSCFKIEGRLKDKAYVMNVVSAYRRQLDQILAAKGLSKNSSGQSQIDFTPDLTKTFNRGYTTHFLRGRATSPGAIDTPKMTGEVIGRVVSVDKTSFKLDAPPPLHPGDGLCFFDSSHTLRGTVVNAAQGTVVTPNDLTAITPGTFIYRNHDHLFLKQVEKSRPERKIRVSLTLTETAAGLALSARDEDGNTATATWTGNKVKADQPDKALANLHKQLRKMGDTDFTCGELDVDWAEIYFMPVSALNGLRREVLARLAAARAQNRPRLRGSILKNDTPYPEKELTYQGNALNQLAVAFYRRHGVTHIDPAAEFRLNMAGRVVMRARYCLKHQLGWCPLHKDLTGTLRANLSGLAEPLYLVDEDGHNYELRFNCAACEMEIVY